MGSDTWDGMFMAMAYAAAQQSKATKLKVGAVAVNNGNVIGVGINGTPTGWYTNEDIDPTTGSTSDCVLHAEENLVSKLARSGAGSDGATLFCTTAPCIKCSRLIVQSGFSRVVYSADYKSEEGLELCRRLGLEVHKHKAKNT
jgi:dCMP deaminase